MAALLALAFGLLFCRPAVAEGGSFISSFNISGPALVVTVTRGQNALPIAEVPQLRAGDVINLKAPFGSVKTVHWLMVVAFLNGATEPPPDSFFHQVELWKQDESQRVHHFTVPEGAQNAIVFLAPDTGGGFGTIKQSVKSQPGIFVRVSQDLINAAYQERRLGEFLDGLHTAGQDNPQTFAQHATALAHSLDISVNTSCFDQNGQARTTCLVSNADTALSSQNSQSSSGTAAGADVIGAAVSNQINPAYSAYVGTFVDVFRMVDHLHTANYQYLPALPQSKGKQVQLMLNHDPIFANPKSVLVYVLPDVGTAAAPEIRLQNPTGAYCVGAEKLVLPVDAPPDFYAASYGHDWQLVVTDAAGHTRARFAATPNAESGGFVVNTNGEWPSFGGGSAFQSAIEGSWGFDPAALPGFTIYQPRAGQWTVLRDDTGRLIAGSTAVLQLQSPTAACAAEAWIEAGDRRADGKTTVEKNVLKARFGLTDFQAGAARIGIREVGLPHPEYIPAQVYAPLPDISGVAIHAGDSDATIAGSHLDEIATVAIDGVKFAPAGKPGEKQLQLTAAAGAQALAAKSGEATMALITLHDGRTLQSPLQILEPRPVVKLQSVHFSSDGDAILLNATDAAPQNSRLVIALHAVNPQEFSSGMKLQLRQEMASEPVTLSLDSGALVLQDRSTMIASFVPAEKFGPDAFGKLDFRLVDATGVSSDWQPLPRLVRLPKLKDVHCPADLSRQCTLTGSDLFLLSAVGNDPKMSQKTNVPAGVADGSITVPRPNGATLYVILRDDPAVVSPVALPVFPDSAGESTNSDQP